MSANFEELDFRPTPIGVLSLRRRRQLSTGIDIYEIKLGDEFLMSSLFTAAEIELARLGLAGLDQTRLASLDVVVGGLGLGYTAQAVLEHRIRRIADRGRCARRSDRMARAGVAADRKATQRRPALPSGAWRLLRDDDSAQGYDPGAPGRRFDAVLVDIDHSPQKLLHPRHAALYAPEGLARVAKHLRPGGVFALWSNDPPDDAFMTRARNRFRKPVAHVVTFPDAQGDGEASNTVYVGVSACPS